MTQPNETSVIYSTVPTKKPVCPKCGKPATCYRRDIGGPFDYVDEYTLVCPGCGVVDRKVEKGGSTSQDNWPTNCPFCGAVHSAHRFTPEEYCKDSR